MSETVVAMPAAGALQRLQRDLVLAYHVLARHGHSNDIAGHVTARLPGADTFWTNRFKLGFDEASIAELHEADMALAVRSGRGQISPALTLHTEIYRRRSDVNAVVHSHPLNAVALSALGVPLAPIDQQAAIFWQDIGFFDEHHGVFIDGQGEADAIAAALGSQRAMILKNHGIVVVGETVREAAVAAIILETAASVQIRAMAAGSLSPMPLEALKQSKAFLSRKEFFDWRFEYFSRRAVEERPGLARLLEGPR
jgi:L-fuculose-phosphate aldolase